MKLTLTIIKPFSLVQSNQRARIEIDITELAQVMSPADLFQFEMVLNHNLPHFRFHINTDSSDERQVML
jgi:hypothetical protein